MSSNQLLEEQQAPSSTLPSSESDAALVEHQTNAQPARPSDEAPSEQRPLSSPTAQRSTRHSPPNGYGMIYNGHIWGIFKDSELGREYEKLTDKKDKVEFLKTKGEDRGKISTTRCRTPGNFRDEGKE